MVEDVIGWLFIGLQWAIGVGFLVHLWRHGRPRRDAAWIPLVTTASVFPLCRGYMVETGELVLPCCVAFMMALSAFVSFRELRKEGMARTA